MGLSASVLLLGILEDLSDLKNGRPHGERNVGKYVFGHGAYSDAVPHWYTSSKDTGARRAKWSCRDERGARWMIEALSIYIAVAMSNDILIT